MYRFLIAGHASFFVYSFGCLSPGCVIRVGVSVSRNSLCAVEPEKLGGWQTQSWAAAWLSWLESMSAFERTVADQVIFYSLKGKRH